MLAIVTLNAARLIYNKKVRAREGDCIYKGTENL